MGLEFFRRAVELGKRCAPPGVTVRHTIQTNGTKINGDWARFFAENGFLVGLSIDGPRELHDAYRRDKAGKPTFDKVMRGLADAPRARCGVERPHHGERRQPGPSRRGLPLPPRRLRLRVHAAHPHRGAADRGRRAAGRRGHRPVRHARGLGCVPDRRVRGVGAPRRRRASSCSSSTSPSPTGTASRPASACTPPPAGPPWPWSSTATCTPATTSSSRRSCAATSATTHLRRARRDSRAGALRRRQAEALPATAASATCASPATAGAPRTASSPRRRGAGAQLPLPRLQGLLPPRRRADAAHVRPAARGTGAGRHRRGVSRARVAGSGVAG